MEYPRFGDSPSCGIETGSRLHTLFHQNVDFVGDRGVNWHLGPGVLDSDHQAEWDRLYVAGPTFVTSLREGVVVLAEIFMVLRPLQRVVLHGATGSASDFGKPAGDTIKAKAMEGGAACYFRKPAEVKIASSVLGGYFRRLK